MIKVVISLAPIPTSKMIYSKVNFQNNSEHFLFKRKIYLTEKKITNKYKTIYKNRVTGIRKKYKESNREEDSDMCKQNNEDALYNICLQKRSIHLLVQHIVMMSHA